MSNDERPPKGFDSSYNGGNLRNGLSHRVAEAVEAALPLGAPSTITSTEGTSATVLSRKGTREY